MKRALFSGKGNNASASAKMVRTTASTGLRVSERDYAFEQEADRMANEVMAGGQGKPGWSLSRMTVDGSLQRKCAKCEEDEQNQKHVQRSGVSEDRDSDTPVSIPSGGGVPMPERLRARMEQRFGASFGDVRIHADESSGIAALSLFSHAFTHGPDIYFAPGQYQPNSKAGLGLLAHELTHVVQQRNSRFPAPRNVDRPAQVRHSLEQEANASAREIQNAEAPLSVHETAPVDRIHPSSFTDILDVRRQLTGGIEAMADFAIARAGSDPLIASLAQLRRELRSAGPMVRLPRELLVEMEALYNQLRGLAPSWLPVPDISFAGAPVQRQGGPAEAVSLGVILLFVAFVLVMIWLVLMSNPVARRQFERAIGRVIDEIRDKLRSPPAAAPPTPIVGAPPVTTTPPTTVHEPPTTVRTTPTAETEVGSPVALRVGDKVRGLTTQIVIHLARILGSAVAGRPPDHQEDPKRDRPHWWTEIMNFVKQILDQGLTRKQLLRELLKEFSEEQLKEIAEAMRRAAELLGEDPPDFPPTATP
jgi:hypothetical protein